MKLNIQYEISDILDKWADIESYIKDVESINDLFVSPAVNELRYAGRALVFALKEKFIENNNDEQFLNEKIAVAKQYLMNAEHDISDSIISYYSKKISQLNEKFGRNNLTDREPTYGSFCDMINASRRLVRHSRRRITKRSLIYKILRKKYIPRLIQCNELADNSSMEFEFERLYNEKYIANLLSKYKTSLSINYGLLLLIAVSAIGIFLRAAF